VLDVISPCVTFNDHEGSTKSYQYVKDHELILQEMDFIPQQTEAEVDYAEGSSTEVELHDGSRLRLRKLGRDHDPKNRLSALQVIDESRRQGEVVTGLLYVNPEMPDLCSAENLPRIPLRDLGAEQLRLTPDEFAGLLKDWE
jgi:2-oxoglutarate ferredoxin oxidoreductase subunit beta